MLLFICLWVASLFLFYTYRVQAKSEHNLIDAYCTGYCLLFVVLQVLPLLQQAVVEFTRT